MARQKKRAKSPVNIPIILAAILLCLTLISIRLAGGIVARYTTTTNSGDSARVIKFGDLTLTLTGGDTQYIIPGVPLNWNASVTFGGSESATYVYVEVTDVHSANSNTVTLFSGGPSWTVDTSYWTPLNGYPGVYYHALAPNVPVDKVTLFANNGNSTAVSDALTAAQIADIGNVTPSFRASVVQSNGFTGPEAAWASLENNH